MKYIKSTTIQATMQQKATMVQATIYAQTGQLRPNLRRHERAPDNSTLFDIPVYPVSSPNKNQDMGL